MSKTYEEEFIFDLESIKHGMMFCGHDTDILQIIWSLKRKVKEFFPMNKVPDEIYSALLEVEEKFRKAEMELHDTVDVIVKRINNERT